MGVSGARARFERRSALYTHLDEQLWNRTRFFAAAAMVNAVLARRFLILASLRPPGSLQFLDEVGAALEADNRAYAKAIRRYSMEVPGTRLDHALVCAEQARVQRYVQAHRMWSPQRWESVRCEINDLLNDRNAASYVARWCEKSARVIGTLRMIRAELRMDLDFAAEVHRVCIGVRLIEAIRREAPPPRCGGVPRPSAWS